MNPWVKIFSEHPVQQTLNSFQSVLDSAKSKIVQGDFEAIQEFERLSSAFEYLKQLFDNSNPQLTNPDLLNNIGTHLINVQNEVSAYSSNQDKRHLHNANLNINVCIHHAIGLPTLIIGKKGQAVSSLLSSVSKTADQILEDLSHQKENLEKKILDLTSDIVEANSEIENLKNSLSAEKEIIKNLSAQYQKQFSDAQERRRSESEQQMRDLQIHINQLMEGLLKSGIDHKNELSQKNDSYIADLKDKISQALSDLGSGLNL